MKITLNNMGQVLDIEKSVLVANSSMDVSIKFVIEGLSTTQKRLMTIGLLSVIREDGFEIKNIVMQRSFSGDDLLFTYALQDAAQILAVPGNIQISAQIKSLKEQYDGMTGDVLSDIENYNTFSSVTVAGFVQHNIGTAREENFANTLVETKIIPVLQTFGEAMNQFVEIKEQFEDIKSNFGDIKKSGDKNYINLSDYVVDGIIYYADVNQKIKELSQKSKGGQDRVQIAFYQGDPNHTFDFENEIVFRSNCDYYYLGAGNLQEVSSDVSAIHLNGISNCRFYGFRVACASASGAALRIADCKNLEFYDCVFQNIYSRGAIISDSRAIYFNDCVISAGNYPSGQDVCCWILDAQTTAGQIDVPAWIIFENCYLYQSKATPSVPIVDCSQVTNTRSLVSVLHCATNDMGDITSTNINKGNGKGKIRLSQLTTI